jgi:hypothetical protein
MGAAATGGLQAPECSLEPRQGGPTTRQDGKNLFPAAEATAQLARGLLPLGNRILKALENLLRDLRDLSLIEENLLINILN